MTEVKKSLYLTKSYRKIYLKTQQNYLDFENLVMTQDKA
jgi:hypothetical protein